MKPLKTLFLFCCCALLALTGSAQQSFVYIQGDKQTPFYVKLEGEMLPRYGKNYCIIPQLAAGPINLEILFQQNAYPAQKFVVQVPENGQRGFLLTKTAEGFSLYDLQQKFYLPAGNAADDDRLPAPIPKAAAAPPEQEPEQNEVPQAPTVAGDTSEEEQKPKKPAAGRKDRLKALRPVPETAPAAPAPTPKDGPVFMDNIELNNRHDVQSSTGTATTEKPSADNETPQERKEEEPVKEENREPDASGVVNSDCPVPASQDEFDRVLKSAMELGSEETRLQYLNNQLSQCFSSSQAAMLARSLDSDAARYVFLKKTYSRITDQAAYGRLAELFSSDEYRDAFKELTHGKE